ncbi:MAG: winged helix-turn-helix domain-containing protein, partial [Acidobacteriota bacterium]
MESGFYVDQWLAEPRLNRLSSAGQVRQLDPRSMEVLVCLAGRPGDVISKDELLDEVWGDTFVTENTVSQAISRLRKALGDDWQEPRFVQTVSKSGYRLIAPVRPAQSALGAPASLGPPAPGAEAPGAAAGLAGQRHSSYWVTRLGVSLPFLLVGSGLLWVWLASASPPNLSLEPVPAVTLIGPEMYPALSPDGTRIAYSWQEPNQNNFDLYVKLIEAENPLRLADAPEHEGMPAWSPEGSFIAFVHGAVETGCGIYRIPAIGGPRERVGDCFRMPRDLIWSPDGNLLAFSDIGDSGQTRRIYVIDLHSRQRRPLMEPPPGSQGDRYPAFSPDGRHLAFRRAANAGQHDIFLYPMQGGAPQRVTFDKGARIRGLDWMPKGREIVFASDRGGRSSLWRVAAGGGAVKRFPIHGHWITQPRTARLKNRLIYKRTIDVIDLWSLRLDDQAAVLGDPQRVAASTRTELHPHLSQDGRRLAFTSNRTGAFEVWTGDLDGSNLRQHTQLQGALVSTPRWSPDGRMLVFDAYRQGQGDLYLVAQDSRSPRRLTLEASDEVNGSFSRDGRWIYFASNRRTGWQIWKMPASGGHPM